MYRSGYMAVEHCCFIIEAYEISLVKLCESNRYSKTQGLLHSKEHCCDACVKHDLNILRTPCFFQLCMGVT